MNSLVGRDRGCTIFPDNKIGGVSFILFLAAVVAIPIFLFTFLFWHLPVQIFGVEATSNVLVSLLVTMVFVSLVDLHERGELRVFNRISEAIMEKKEKIAFLFVIMFVVLFCILVVISFCDHVIFEKIRSSFLSFYFDRLR